ncbi:glycosyl hydrolase [Halocatena marina]|uniref:glycosyl hydrolase n=1 Tax=Halocatena marina TaxID=2934937 RepID=UPI002224C0E9|nr:glycosyl hydrolase [Halocatena marina]
MNYTHNRSDDESGTTARSGRDLLRLNRRDYLAATGGLAGFVGLGSGITAASSFEHNGDSQIDRNPSKAFGDPNADVRPKFRWWWPSGNVEPEEITDEVNSIADAGFGGAEIAYVNFAQIGANNNAEKFDWGSPAWNQGVETALQAAKARDITIDLTITPFWPASLPTIEPDNEAATKELAHGQTRVNGGETFSGAVPQPASDPSGAGQANPNPSVTPTLVSVQAARVIDEATDGSPVELQQDSLIDLTTEIKNGELTWTAPDDGEWLLIAYWKRGTAQFTHPSLYVVDHYGKAGTQAIIDYWENNLLTSIVRGLLPEVGGTMFEDSLELDATTFWTPRLPAEFEDRMGYSLNEYLPLILKGDETGSAVYTYGKGIRSQLRNDFEETLGELYLENHVEMLQEWVHSIGLEFRNQPYSMEMPMPSITTASETDVPEGETLGFRHLDSYRALAGGRDIAGNQKLSDETGGSFPKERYPEGWEEVDEVGFLGASYRRTWGQVLSTVSEIYTAGVNQSVLHGFSYADAPSASWPGWHAFGTVAMARGPRQPTWKHINTVSGYMGRSQEVLQNATSKADIAIYQQQDDVSTGAFFDDKNLSRAGYTYQFLSPGVLDHPNAIVSNGRLTPEGPAYKAFVIAPREIDQKNTMPLDVAENILSSAADGLPVVMVGQAPDHVPGNPEPGENEQLRAVVDEILDQSSVQQVESEEDVLEALTSQGIQPTVEHAEPAPLLNARRAGEDVNYYFLYNGSDSNTVNQTVSFTGNSSKGVPYSLNPWTGDITRIASYEKSNGQIKTPITLAPDESAILAIAPQGWYEGSERLEIHATDTQADEVVAVDGELAIQDTQSGTYTTKLSNGTTVETKIGNVPDMRTLSNWDLTVEDWQPGDSVTETNIVEHEIELDTLKPWKNISELQDISGVGRYSTTIELDDGWTGGYGAYLDLGDVFDTFQVTVNGQQLTAVDQVNPVADIGPYLESGINEIEVEVATTLNNRLRVAQPDRYGDRSRQSYGLLGPVKFIPYGQTEIRNSSQNSNGSSDEPEETDDADDIY